MLSGGEHGEPSNSPLLKCFETELMFSRNDYESYLLVCAEIHSDTINWF